MSYKGSLSSRDIVGFVISEMKMCTSEILFQLSDLVNCCSSHLGVILVRHNASHLGPGCRFILEEFVPSGLVIMIDLHIYFLGYMRGLGRSRRIFRLKFIGGRILNDLA
jgi:hypothetical protein